jgi:UDP-N-acetylmuramoyl-tripeptide--D-alanyl-D-alanine ligase
MPKLSANGWRQRKRGNVVELNMNEVAQLTGGKILQGSPSVRFHTFNFDSRLSQPGELFFALIARRNGHDFLAEAVRKGASGAVISQNITAPDQNIALIQVNDTLLALQNLAQKVIADHPAKVVGITGSIGKTTTKEFIANLLACHFNVLKSEGNFNNHIGLPLSILKLQDTDQIIVLEMGMSHPGEITRLTQIAPPDIAVITNINPVHLEFFPDMEGIARAKREILEGMKTNGTAILNGDDPYTEKISGDLEQTKLLFGLSAKNDIRARNIQRRGTGGISFDLHYGRKKEEMFIPYLYKSFLSNFLAASAVAYALSIPLEHLKTQTSTLKPFPMRGEVLQLKNDIILVDDSYNSNPAALESALKDLAELETERKVAILGDMLELGKKEIDYHLKAGKQVKENNWNLLITVGPLSRYMAEAACQAGMRKEQVLSYENAEEAATRVEFFLRSGDLVLVKGSRGMKTEKIVERLKEKGT